MSPDANHFSCLAEKFTEARRRAGELQCLMRPSPKTWKRCWPGSRMSGAELADLLTTQGKSRDRVIEVEQILLRDASANIEAK